MLCFVNSSSLRTLAFLIVSGVGWGLVSTAARAEVDGDLEALQGVAGQIEANQAQVDTWQGEVEVHSFSRVVPDGFEQTTRSRVTFAYDREREASRFTWRYIETSGMENHDRYTGVMDGWLAAGMTLGET